MNRMAEYCRLEARALMAQAEACRLRAQATKYRNAPPDQCRADFDAYQALAAQCVETAEENFNLANLCDRDEVTA